MPISVDTNDYHRCHFCGENVNKEGYEFNGKRHFLSDCRPDLVEHEIGDTCTWAYQRETLIIGKDTPNERIQEPVEEKYTCCAYQDRDCNWTDEHKHFYPDGPM